MTRLTGTKAQPTVQETLYNHVAEEGEPLLFEDTTQPQPEPESADTDDSPDYIEPYFQTPAHPVTPLWKQRNRHRGRLLVVASCPD